jgi:hypothetical protein
MGANETEEGIRKVRLVENNRENNINPSIFVRSITFNDGTPINLHKKSIVIFTGANNCGKSPIALSR